MTAGTCIEPYSPRAAMAESPRLTSRLARVFKPPDGEPVAGARSPRVQPPPPRPTNGMTITSPRRAQPGVPTPSYRAGKHGVDMGPYGFGYSVGGRSGVPGYQPPDPLAPVHWQAPQPQPPPAFAPRPPPAGTPRGRPAGRDAAGRGAAGRDAHLVREAAARAMVAAARERIAYQRKKGKMKAMLQAVSAAPRGEAEVSVAKLLLAADLAKLHIDSPQRALLLDTPQADLYATARDITRVEHTEPSKRHEHRNRYGLDARPKAISVSRLTAAMPVAPLAPGAVEAMLRRYADNEAELIGAEAQRRKAKEEVAEYNRVAVARGEALRPPPISDADLRAVHKLVKQRISTTHNSLRKVFRYFDRSKSGKISSDDFAEALVRLNVGVPRRILDHLVNIADTDRDGEIDFKEFARVMAVEDIASLKCERAIKQGNVAVDVEEWKPGIRKSEIAWAQAKLAEMFEERGGVGRMFRRIDENKDGFLSRHEVRMMLHFLNLSSVIRPPVAEAMIDLMDVNGDDRIEYKQFCHITTAEDPFNLHPIAQGPKQKVVVPTPGRAERKRSYGSNYKPLAPAHGTRPKLLALPIPSPRATRQPPRKEK